MIIFWMQAKIRVEEANKAALEAERRAAKKAAEREATEALERIMPAASQGEATRRQMDGGSVILNYQSKGPVSDRITNSQSAGILFFNSVLIIVVFLPFCLYVHAKVVFAWGMLL